VSELTATILVTACVIARRRGRGPEAKIDAIADMLGHSDPSTSRIYAKIVDKMTENPARYLEAMLTA